MARSLLAICAILVALLAAAALLVVARLLAGQREGESAMLTARGATRRQLAGLALAEALPLCVIAAGAGGAGGLWLAARLARTGSAPATAALAAAWPAAAVVAAGALLIMLIPVLQTAAPGTARARRGRQAAIAGITRAGADVALVLLAVLAGWELRRYSAVPSSGTAAAGHGVDPVLVAAPALALAGGGIAALRLLPAAGRAGDWLAARGRRLTAALASWQISRQPVRQGTAALLVVLAVATGTLVLAQRQSGIRSDQDQAAFTAGADVRVTVDRAADRRAGRDHQPPARGPARHAGDGLPGPRGQRGDAGHRRPAGRGGGAAAPRPVTAAGRPAVRPDRPGRPGSGITLPGAPGADPADRPHRPAPRCRSRRSSSPSRPRTPTVTPTSCRRARCPADGRVARPDRPHPRRDRDLPDPADRDHRVLHAARGTGHRSRRAHRGPPERRPGHGPGARFGAEDLAGGRVVAGAVRCPRHVPGTQRAVRAARRGAASTGPRPASGPRVVTFDPATARPPAGSRACRRFPVTGQVSLTAVAPSRPPFRPSRRRAS